MCRKPLAEILHAIAKPLYANAGPLSLVLTTPRLRVSTTLRQSRRRAVGRGRAVPFAERLYEADERIAEESRGHREFARTPEPSLEALHLRVLRVRKEDVPEDLEAVVQVIANASVRP
jgi:hypothetical protein